MRRLRLPIKSVGTDDQSSFSREIREIDSDGPRGRSLAITGTSNDGGAVNTRNDDEWTVERWRLEPRYVLEFDDSAVEKAPPLWKDLTLAAIFVLVLLLAAAAVILG